MRIEDIHHHKNLTESNTVDISKIANNLEFKPVTKLPLQYTYIPDGYPDDMPQLSYTQSRTPQKIITITDDGKETENIANIGDFIFSGPSKEKYVLTLNKLKKNYTGTPGQTLVPEQGTRLVAKYQLSDIVYFIAPWGSKMVLKPGDFLVKSEDGYYRIAAKEYQQTYNLPK